MPVRRLLALFVFGASISSALPTCSQGAAQVVRVGSTLTLTATASGSGTLTYLWEYVAPTQPGAPGQSLNFSSTTASSTNITSFVFGPVNIKLTVTDINGSTSCTVHHGAVQTDSAGNAVVTGTYADKVSTLLGPMTIMNRSCDLTSCDSSAGSWADQLQFNFAYHFGQAQGTAPTGTVSFIKDWETRTTPGTISVSNGGSVVTGSSTTFGTTFCGSTSFPCTPVDPTALIIIWYCTSGTAPTCFNSLATSGRRYYGISSVASQTSMTLSGGPAGGTWLLSACSGCYFSTWRASGNSWFGQSTNNNYYDDVKFFYATYYRTGIEDFLGYARWLADAWYQSPLLDQLTCSGGLYSCPAPRIRSIEGIVLRAMDEDAVAGSTGSSSKWVNIRSFWINQTSAEVTGQASAPILDLREESYSMGELAADAITNPNSTEAQSALVLGDNQLKTTGRWALQRHTDAYMPWANIYGTYGGPSSSIFSNAGSITATNGSSTITLVGGTWTAGMFCNASNKGYVTMGTNPLSGSGWDQRGYIATFVDSTHATLDANYAGTTGSGKIWVLNGAACDSNSQNWAGIVTQPFMLGITSNMMRLWAYALVNSGTSPPLDSTTAATINTTFLPAIATSLGTTGLNTDTCASPCTIIGLQYRGPYYGVGGAVCMAPYGPLGNVNNCYGAGTVQEARLLSPELLAAISTGYCLTHDSNLLTYGNNYYSAMFAKSMSQSGYDGGYIADMDIGGFFWSQYTGKWPAFLNGYGRGYSWLSASIGCGTITGSGTKISGAHRITGGVTIH